MIYRTFIRVGTGKIDPLLSAAASTVAAGAVRIRMYTSCGYCSDNALACNEQEPVERLLAAPPERTNAPTYLA